MRATIANVVLGPGRETHLPLGPLHIVSCFENAGFAVDFRDYQVSHPAAPLRVRSLIDFLYSPDPVLGISCYFNLMPLVLLALDEIKRRDPHKLIIMGGPGPSACPRELMQAFPAIDIIVRGEGEETTGELLGRLDGDLAEVKGIYFRRNGEIVATPPRARIRNLNALPGPAYHAVNLGAYTCVALHTARGCPFECGFCQVAPLWGRTTRNRRVDAVVNEIAMLYHEHGIDYVRLADDTLTLSRKRVLEFVGLMKERLPNVRWSCMGRLDLVDESLLAQMAEGGCVGIQYGVESGSASVLERVGRPYSPTDVLKAIRVSVRHMSHVVCTLIWGFPFETMDDFYMTITLMGKIAELGADIKILSLMPTPLSMLYQEFGHDLGFDPQIAANTIYSGYEAKRRASDGKDLDALLALIEDHPRLFPDFYFYKSETFDQKRKMLARLRMA